jgi:hypothetical protein
VPQYTTPGVVIFLPPGLILVQDNRFTVFDGLLGIFNKPP